MRRREFLQVSGGALASSLVGCRTTAPTAAVSPYESAYLPVEKRPDGIVEMFLLGGLSPWESFYTVPEYGQDDKTMWWAFQDRGPLTVPAWYAGCGGPAGQPLYTPYAQDANGVVVNLGPFIYPLRNRPDLLSRMRVWVIAHDQAPHEAAIPLAVSGHLLGNPRMASLGAHYQRHFQQLAPAGRTAPWAYTVYMSSFSISANAGAASAVGLHRPSARPFAIQLGPDSRLIDQLPRPRVQGWKSELDAAVAYYQAQAERRLTSGTHRVRAQAFDDYAAARLAMQNHAPVRDLLQAELLESTQLRTCIPDPLSPTASDMMYDEQSTSMALARHLLLNESAPAKYVQIMEGGIFTDEGGQGYDSHGEHVRQQGPNASHAMRSLADSINRPGENDPSKLDLDRHFVLVNTEFGRAPSPEFSVRNPNGVGTDHWPYGYVVVGFGGFVDPSRAGIVGAIGPDGFATQSITPADHRAAMMLSMGIWPFTEEAFAVGDMSVGDTEMASALHLKKHVLGYDV